MLRQWFVIFFMKKSSLLLASVITIPATLSAQAYDFNDKIYGKANLSIGYSFQEYNSKDIEIVNGDEFTNKNFHTILIGGGYDIFYGASNLVHPFIGLDFEGRIPMKYNLIKHYWNGDGNADKFWSIKDFFSAHLKFGAKFNVSSSFALSTYGLFGLTLLQSGSKGYVSIDEDGNFHGHSAFKNEDENITTKYNIAKTYIGISTGAGVNAIYNFNNKFAIFTAVEYQCHILKNQNIYTYHHMVYDKFVGGNNADEWTGTEKINDYISHQVGVKLGVQFL